MFSNYSVIKSSSKGFVKPGALNDRWRKDERKLNGLPSVLSKEACLACDIITWYGCAITLLLTYLAQRVREASHCSMSCCVCVCIYWLCVRWIQAEWKANWKASRQWCTDGTNNTCKSVLLTTSHVVWYWTVRNTNHCRDIQNQQLPSPHGAGDCCSLCYLQTSSSALYQSHSANICSNSFHSCIL